MPFVPEELESIDGEPTNDSLLVDAFGRPITPPPAYEADVAGALGTGSIDDVPVLPVSDVLARLKNPVVHARAVLAWRREDTAGLVVFSGLDPSQPGYGKIIVVPYGPGHRHKYLRTFNGAYIGTPPDIRVPVCRAVKN